MMTANIGTTLHVRAAAETQRIAEAYRACVRIANSHYENFTVGYWLLPRELRRHMAAIYAFARIADDIADEGSHSAEERLLELRRWEAGILRAHSA